MIILFLFARPIIESHGGVERVTSILSREFVKLGHDVYYLSMSKPNDDCKSEESAFHQYYLDAQDINGQLEQFLKIIEDKHIDIVLNQMFCHEVVVLLQHIVGKIRIISTFHSQPFATYKKERIILKNWESHSCKGLLFKYIGILFPWLVRQYYIQSQRTIFKSLIQLSDRYCLLSDRFIWRIEKFLPKAERYKLIAINNPNTFSGDCYLKKKENVVLFVGRIENLSKNVFDFIRMWNVFSQTHKNWSAIVVGDGSDLTRVKLLSQRLHTERISFVGHQKDVSKYYMKSKILCCTSNNEGWGMILVEAMQWGCVPVVYDTFESVHDIIENKINGLIVEPNLYTMVSNLEILVNNETLLNFCSGNAQKKVKQFSADKIAKQWNSLFEELKEENHS